MRTLSRNKVQIYYQLYLGKTERVDADGNLNGKYIESYSEKIPLRCHVSYGTLSAVASGNKTQLVPYGVEDNYSMSLFLDRDYGMSETTILWIGDTEEANYIVSSVRPSLSGLVVTAKALKQ